MGRRKSKCTSCRRLKISCDGCLPCEYCVATDRHCQYEGALSDDEVALILSEDSASPPQSLFPLRLMRGFSSIFKMNLSPIQSRLITFFGDWGVHHYGDSRDARQETIWTELVPQLFHKSDLVKSGMYTYSGVLMVQASNHRLLQDPDFVTNNPQAQWKYDQTLVAAYQYSLYAFTVQTSEISRLLQKIHAGTLAPQEAVELLLGSMLIIATLCCSPSSQMPLVNFEHRKDDFLCARLGVRVTFILARPFLEHDPELMEIFYSKAVLEAPEVTQWVPLFASINSSFDSLDTPLDQKERQLLQGTLNRFNNSILDCADTASDIPLIQAAAIMDGDFVAMIYNKHIIALEIIYAFSCFSLLTSPYYSREGNMFSDYMEWYRGHCFERYGQWRFPWDASVYSVAPTKQYYPVNLQSLPFFDPVELDGRLT
ncbi:hypothetical protein DICA4_E22364 [Diutina catenulata]